MRTWILAFALVFVAGSAVAEETSHNPAEAASSATPSEAPAPSPESADAVAELEALEPVAELEPAVEEAAPVAEATTPAPAEIPEPSAVPPIPPPSEPMTASTPLDGRWRIPNAEPRAEGRGLTIAMPTIPSPIATSPAAPAPGSDSRAEAPAPAPKKVRPPFDPAGTIHVVEKGDTLWDISDLYLGTPWIWPSVWRDNEEIENPHLILPGDKIWVSANEMRKVSDEEAAALLAGKNAGDPGPAALAEDAGVPATVKPRETFQYSELSTVGLVRKKELKGLAQIVGTIEEAVFLSQGDVVFIDLGEEDAVEGDRFTIFRTSEQVHDPSTRRRLGYHTEIVGWLEVLEVHGSTARAQIRMSYADFVPGAYLKPHEPVDPVIEILDSPEGVEGQIADLLIKPKYNAGGDVIVLNRGSEHGLQVGSTLEVYRPVSTHWKENWYGRQPDVEIPHEVVAELLVLNVQPHTSMAYVGRSKTELWYGDRFRTVNGPSVEWPEGGYFILPRLKGLAKRLPSPSLSMPELDVPGVDVPNPMADWNMPRLALPGLDDYDPR